MVVKSAGLRSRDALADIAVDGGRIVEILPNLNVAADKRIGARGAVRPAPGRLFVIREGRAAAKTAVQAELFI